MGELGITTNDLGPCPKCNRSHPMMFETLTKKTKILEYWIACGFCNHQTKHKEEILEAADDWGLV